MCVDAVVYSSSIDRFAVDGAEWCLLPLPLTVGLSCLDLFSLFFVFVVLDLVFCFCCFDFFVFVLVSVLGYRDRKRHVSKETGKSKRRKRSSSRQ